MMGVNEKLRSYPLRVELFDDKNVGNKDITTRIMTMFTLKHKRDTN